MNNFNPTPPERTKGFQHFERGVEDEIGLDGEKVFVEYLKNKGLSLGDQEDRILWWKLNKHYVKQRYDFIINKWTIDIKTVEDESFKIRFLLPVFEEIKCDFYVAVKLPDQICGYLTADEVRKLPVKNFGCCDARWEYLDDLNDIENMMRIVTGEKK